MAEYLPLIAVVLVMAAASFVQSATGFGLALVAMAGLPLFMSVNESVSLVAVLNLLVSVSIIFLNRTGFSWHRTWPLALAVLIGIPIGYFGMKQLEGDFLIRTLGLVLVLIALFDLRLSRNQKDLDKMKLPRWAAFPVGLTGGVLGGAFNTGGPPIVAYTYSQNWPKIETVAVLQTSFLAGGIMRNVLMGLNGDYSRELFTTAGWSVMPVILAIWLGKLTLDRVPRELLRRIVFIFVLVMGLKYLIRP